MKKRVSTWRVALLYSAVFGAISMSPASVAATTTKVPAPTVKTVSSTMSLGAFEAISASGNLAITLTTGSNSSSHTLHIDHPSNQNYSIAVKNRVLTIKQTTPWWQRVKPAVISVDVSQLKKLTLIDAASLKVSDLNSPSLAIDADTAGSIDIDGTVGLTSLVSKGPGNIQVSWVDSPLLKIDSYGSGTIKLSGKVEKLEASMSGHGTLEAQYLRANSIMVQTNKFARALVMPLSSLNAFAHGYSNIFYFKTPKNFSHFTSESGNVLQLQWRQQ